MNLSEKAADFIAPFGLTDVCEAGDELRLGPADYWKFANQAAQLSDLDTNADGKKPGFLATVQGFDIYLDNDVVGTGLTQKT